MGALRYNLNKGNEETYAEKENFQHHGNHPIGCSDWLARPIILANLARRKETLSRYKRSLSNDDLFITIQKLLHRCGPRMKTCFKQDISTKYWYLLAINGEYIRRSEVFTLTLVILKESSQDIFSLSLLLMRIISGSR